MRKIQHTAKTCPGRPCGSECDHIEFVKQSPANWHITMLERTSRDSSKKMWEHSSVMTKRQAMNAASNKLREEMLSDDVIVWLKKNTLAVIVNAEGDLLHSIYATLEKVRTS